MGNIPLNVSFFEKMDTKKNDGESIDSILEYLFSLQENIYYILGHLNESNFGGDGLRRLTQGAIKNGIQTDNGVITIEADGIYFCDQLSKRKVVDFGVQNGGGEEQ